jgi:hypothetical protein
MMALAGLPAVPVRPILVAATVREAQQPGQSTGRIAGSIVGAESGQPVRFAKVTLGSIAGDKQVLTDDSGTFAFEGLRPGTYKLQVSKPGYLATAYGQLRPGTNTLGRDIVLRERERLDRLVVQLSHGGSISGSVRDDRGEPAYRATVVVSRWVMRNGVRALDAIAQAQTDERGNYRLSLLPPRDYVISAVPSDDAIPSVDGNANPYGFATIFYPGQTSAQAAETIALKLGEDRMGVNLQVPAVPLGRVTGTVVAADGRFVQGARVTLSIPGSSVVEYGASTDSNGRFTFAKVLPGSYAASVRVNPQPDFAQMQLAVTELNLRGAQVVGSVEVNGFSIRPAGAKPDAGPPPPPPPSGSAAADVTVAGNAASDVLLTLEPLKSINGRVVFEGQGRKPSNVMVSLPGLAGASGAFNVKVNADGTFTIPNVAPGRYSINVPGLPSPWELASATAGGVETLDFSLEMPRGRDLGDLTITIRDRATEVSGTVTDAAGQPVGDRTVVVFAADERLWAFGQNRIQASPLYDGQFSFSHFRPGSYRIAVVDGVEPEEWLDPEFLRRLIPASVAITLGEGEKKVQDLRVK